jgi:folate-dependent phosphoribosylglycinamide formyltransferase PurN
MDAPAPIVALTNGSPQSWAVLNAIASEFGPFPVLTEEPEPRRDLILRRMRRQGVVPVAGQILFVLLQKLIASRSGARVQEIIRHYRLVTTPDPACPVHEIGSVNSDACRSALVAFKPHVVIVYGTRIIGRATLGCVAAPFVNLHSGINPAYRGQAGGYWARAMGDIGNVGVTVHLVDSGVDTGAVLYQERVNPAPRDNFSTIFWLQAAALRSPAVRAVGDALAGKLQPFAPDLPSRQFYHPTLWFYLWAGLSRGAW